MNSVFKNIIVYSSFMGLIILLDSCSKESDPLPSQPTSNNSSSTKFLGSWNVSEKSKLYGSFTYNLNISDSTDNTIFFTYLYGFKTKVMASTLNNNITISSQIIEGNRISGTGLLLNDKQMNVTYFVDNGLNKDTVTDVLKR